MEELLTFDFERAIGHLLRLGLAFVFALPIAWDREMHERTLGLRTFPLVAMASAGYVLVAQTVFGPGASEQARIMQGLITGIGFLGGGAIVKRGLSVHGTATAASIWLTAAMGTAVAYSLLEIAFALAVGNFVTLRFLSAMKRLFGNEDDVSPRDDDEDDVNAKDG